MKTRYLTTKEFEDFLQTASKTEGVELVGAGWIFQMRSVKLETDSNGHTHFFCDSTMVDVDVQSEHNSYELHDDNTIWVWQRGVLVCRLFVIEIHPLENFGIRLEA